MRVDTLDPITGAVWTVEKQLPTGIEDHETDAKIIAELRNVYGSPSARITLESLYYIVKMSLSGLMGKDFAKRLHLAGLPVTGSIDACAKCGACDAKKHWCGANDPCDLLIANSEDHIHANCQKCGFFWVERCLDNAAASSAQMLGG